MFHDTVQRHASPRHHHGYVNNGPVPIKNLDRYQRSWKLDVGFQKLQKRSSERMRRESTLPPLTLGLSRNSHTSFSRKQFYADETYRTSQHAHAHCHTQRHQSRSTARHTHRLTSRSKSEQSYSVRLYRKSNNGLTRVAHARRVSSRRRASSNPAGSSRC